VEIKAQWDNVGMSRNESNLKATIEKIAALKYEFWQNVGIIGESKGLNQQLELAGRVADFLELGQLMSIDALARNESCGSHFRSEYQTVEGEAQRDDLKYSHVSTWEYTGQNSAPALHEEPLVFLSTDPSRRTYK
jgi:succinate dehydrogenase / fumarate reductase, flavoprotein subunit